MEHIQLHVGQETVLTLPGRGTAGYTWTYETAGDTAVLSVTLGAAPPTEQSPTPKSGSLPETATLRGLTNGHVVLRLRFGRSWDAAAKAAEVREYDVVVTK
jgi:predicted secreted protein